MGIKNLKKIINEYIEQKDGNKKISSTVCYLDFTSKLILATTLINKSSQKDIVGLNIVDKINKIIDTIVEMLNDQIVNNRFYNKFVIAFDYKTECQSLNFKFDDILRKKFIDNLKLTKDKLDATPMIPKTIDIFCDDSKKYIKNLYEIKYSYWNPTKKIIEYISLNTKFLESTDEKEKAKIMELMNYGYDRYILLRGAKNIIRRERSKNIKSKINSSDYTNDNEVVKILKSDNFDISLKNYIHNVPYNLIVSLVPYIVKKAKERIKANIEYIGCENESDFAIRKHILTYCQTGCPTVYTHDTDMFLLLADIECIVKYPYNGHNVSIFPHEFWKWVFKRDDFNFEDVVNYCINLGTDYKDKQLSYEIFTQLDKIENSIQFIQDEDLDINIIKLKYYNILTKNLN